MTPTIKRPPDQIRAIKHDIKMGALPGIVITPQERLSDFINQNGVGPGEQKLAQFRGALALRGTPSLYAQDGRCKEATVHVKLFDPAGSGTWYLLEWDGQEEAYGYVTGLGGCAVSDRANTAISHCAKWPLSKARSASALRSRPTSCPHHSANSSRVYETLHLLRRTALGGSP